MHDHDPGIPVSMITTVLFDLGNVLLHFNHRLIGDRLRAFAAGRDSHAATERCKELAESFERGQIGSDAFINECLTVMHSFGAIDRDTFTAMWNDIFWINEPLAELLPGIARRARLVLLSNTNPLHITFVRSRFPRLFEPFAIEILSCETGAMKPETHIFELALARANVQPEECLYFDDIRLHVESAARLGINAYQYVSVQGVREILAVYDLLPTSSPTIRT